MHNSQSISNKGPITGILLTLLLMIYTSVKTFISHSCIASAGLIREKVVKIYSARERNELIWLNMDKGTAEGRFNQNIVLKKLK